MTTSIENTKGAADKIVLSIDAMGGDRGPAAVVAGVARAAKQNAHLHFIIHGKKSVLDLQVAKRRALWGRVDIRDTSDVVSMDDKPSQVLRSGKIPRCGLPSIRCATAKQRSAFPVAIPVR